MKNKKSKHILILVNHRKDRSPGQRFRFEQYLELLEEEGCKINFSILLNEKDDKIFYSYGNYGSKLIIFIKCFFKRFFQIFTVNRYDVILVYREAYFIGTTFFEKSYRLFSKAKFIYDFDDSIWIEAESIANKKFNWLKNPAKTAEIIKICDLITIGNEYLKNYALQFNKNSIIIPTTIDTDEYQRFLVQKNNDKICIGWSGSFSTIEHFETVIEALKILKQQFGEKIYFKVIGDANYKNKELEITGIGWSKKDEIKELSEIDIGIMPLPDNDWAKGKCGLKGLQYMALEIPTIMSPVGVNSEIIKDGFNGFLASSTKDWVNKISILVSDNSLRTHIGKEGRKTVIDKYSISANKKLYKNVYLGHS